VVSNWQQSNSQFDRRARVTSTMIDCVMYTARLTTVLVAAAAATPVLPALKIPSPRIDCPGRHT